MVYNKAKEERKWRLWKEAKEKQLRSLGVGAEDIEKLRVHDWAVFNSDKGTMRNCRMRVHILRKSQRTRHSPK